MADHVKREYDNRSRADAARATQERTLRAAHTLLLLEQGYSGLTMARLAEAADVSVPFLYKAFGPKPRLVKRVYDVLMAGDLEPVTVAERPGYAALLAEPDARRKIAIYAGLAAGLVTRAGPLTAVLVAAARAGEPELQEFLTTIEAERLTGATMFARHLDEHGALAPGLTVEQARDLVWLHISADVYRMLVVDRGWSVADYAAWFEDSLAGALLAADRT